MSVDPAHSRSGEWHPADGSAASDRGAAAELAGLLGGLMLDVRQAGPATLGAVNVRVAAYASAPLDNFERNATAYPGGRLCKPMKSLPLDTAGEL